jgi:hypothetical protein
LLRPVAMSVDLAKLPDDEEMLRVWEPEDLAIQNVLDALNYYRCLALHCREELARAELRSPGSTAGDES